MLEQFEQQFMYLYWKYQKQQWCHYYEDGQFNLNTIDQEIFDLVSWYKGKIDNKNRKSFIANLIINRNLVDKDKAVYQLRNKLDDYNHYNDHIPTSLNLIQRKLLIAKSMKEDVISLMNLRNQKAVNLGYTSYTDLVFQYDEIKQDKTIHLLNQYLTKNLNHAKELIKKYNIHLDTWFSDLNKIKIDELSYSPYKLARELFGALGFNNLKITIENKTSSICSMASQLSSDDIRIMLDSVTSLSDLSTLFHELGHAIYYSLIKEKGIYQVLPPSLDEVMAVVVESIVPIITMNKEVQEKLADIRVLEYTRCSLSALFEFKLGKDPRKAEDLYDEFYGKLGIPIEDASIWAMDSFRSIDPVYIHHYVIGATLSDQIIDLLSNNYHHDYHKWGEWLSNNCFSKGRKKSITDLLNQIGL